MILWVSNVAWAQRGGSCDLSWANPFDSDQGQVGWWWLVVGRGGLVCFHVVSYPTVD